MTGRGRDLLTPVEGDAVELASGSFRIRTSPLREILDIAAAPDHPRLGEMVGVRAGGASRTALGEVLGDLRGTPLFQIPGDFAGAIHAGGWIWSRWTAGVPARHARKDR